VPESLEKLGNQAYNRSFLTALRRKQASCYLYLTVLAFGKMRKQIFFI
jgi:hypothetical protein